MLIFATTQKASENETSQESRAERGRERLLIRCEQLTQPCPESIYILRVLFSYLSHTIPFSASMSSQGLRSKNADGWILLFLLIPFEVQLWEKQHPILVSDADSIPNLGEITSALQGVAVQLVPQLSFLKIVPLFCQASCFRVIRQQSKTGEF